jgi:CBS domain-containing protein
MEAAMQVSEIMTRDVELVSPDMPIPEAARRMRDGDVGALPVGDEERLMGMVTDRDIVVRAIAEDRLPSECTVSDVLSQDVQSCRESDSVEDAANIMAEHQIRRLPVLDENQRLVGIVALGDIGRQDQDAGGAALDDISEPTEAAHA